MLYYSVALLGNATQPFTYQCKHNIQILEQVRVSLRGKERLGAIVAEVEKPDFKCANIISVEPLSLSKAQFKIAKFISEYYVSSLGEALGLFIPFSTKKIVAEVEPLSIEVKLSKKQSEAVEFAQKHRLSLLFGDTGSGKTEIYMKLFEQMLQVGKRSLFLLPEISLTPQIEKRLRDEFGSSVTLWHSKQSKKERSASLEKIESGEATIVVGPRSALFLPIDNLGLIVVDEEHDDSYKSSQKPRYHARDVAILMGKEIGAKVLLGSATPSLNSYHKFPHFRLKGGYYKQRKNYIFESSKEAITPLIENSVAQRVGEGKQAIIFIPTRANFKYISCQECGYTYGCPYCSVGMSLHAHKKLVRCHYCGFVEPIPKECPECKSEQMSATRLGTAEALEHFKDRMPQIRAEQFDRDVVSTQKKLRALLNRFNKHEIDLLIGTQMLSKGHDYASITLAVLLGIDRVLNMPDFRAREKSLSLAIQIAGRSGREGEATVLVQTHEREFFERYLEDYELFLKEELPYREELYPPFMKLARVIFSHADSRKAQSAMESMLNGLNSFKDVEVIGSGKAPIEKIASRWRYTILLRAEKSTELLRAIYASRGQLAQVDMDPVEFA